MQHDAAKRRREAKRVRDGWRQLSRWTPRDPGLCAVEFGHVPIRIAIRDPADGVEARSSIGKEEARERLRRVLIAWPTERKRLAIEADTGIGKTHAAVELCAAHACGTEAGAVLYVVHDCDRVEAMVAKIREAILRAGGNAAAVTDLLGRQALHPEIGEDWAERRFGCKNVVLARRFGARGRQVQREVCRGCPCKSECRVNGYLGHTEDALRARILVTTMAKLRGLSERLWKHAARVICDEDVMPGLLQEFWVVGGDLRRALRWIRQRARAIHKGPGSRDLTAALPLIEGALVALKNPMPDGAQALINLLPTDCEQLATEEGLRELKRAMPCISHRDRSGGRTKVYGDRFPAPWERLRPGSAPRQVWGRFISAYIADVEAGNAVRTATVRVVPSKRPGRLGRIHCLRFDLRTIQKLRDRPLLLLDATLHPAISPVLEVERETIRYDQGRTIVQTLSRLLGSSDLCVGSGGTSRLTVHGQRAIAQIAAWIDGHHAYVLCRKGLLPLLQVEASRYTELRRTEFVTVKRERGWNAKVRADRFVVLGRYAKNGDACLREARALRSVFAQLTGSTREIDALERAAGPEVFRGRGAPLLYRGELVERVSGGPRDRLAALLQDSDRLATVSQFIGRDRTGTALVLLYRGDPTIAADGLVDARDLPAATPAADRVLVGGRTRV